MIRTSTINAFKEGNKVAFKEIYDHYYHILIGFSRKFIFCKSSCEDIVQNTFVNLWEERKRINEPKAIKSYLYSSVRNACLNHITRKKVNVPEQVLWDLKSEEYCDRQLIIEEVNSRIYSAIEQLPLQTRRVVILTLQEAKNAEIAERLNVSVNTVKTLKQRAFSKLRLILRSVELVVSFILT
ncbi:RNA polymerase sigma-70 factor [Carboxylicivirga taeanensis]|uniref:RNA polymerase sigma-70 factor n=1 Tax=Carboxylicivirga taeanensis TaxID=1416875 RepID=UPI003F6E3482